MLPLYQCLHQCGRVLLAATSSRLDTFSIDDGVWLSSWTCPTSLEENTIDNSQPTEENDFEPAAKKRRLSHPHDTGETAAAKVATQKSNQQITTVSQHQSPAVIALSSTRAGDHVIVVTGEDKSIRVLRHDGRGQFRFVSQRIMPKRPCAIALTADEATIVCGDKFGDVYSIPLDFSFSSPGSERPEEPTETSNLAIKQSRPFMPAASDLTVHSIRNRRALQNQIKQKHSMHQKFEPNFERKLLLGHVSMLTDIALVEQNGKSYIITADRDEHIRISRGIPQAHIIEGYCLGHKEFVSKLCLPAGQLDLLISGGGDDDLYVWDWSLGKLLHKINLRRLIEKLMIRADLCLHVNDEVEGTDVSSPKPVRIAVSNIQHMIAASEQQSDLIMVTCEGIPAIFIFSFQENFTLSHHYTLRLDGNPLDLVIDGRSNSVIVSVDSAHTSGSIIQLRNDLDPKVQPLQLFQNINSEWVKRPLQFTFASGAVPPISESGTKNLADLLYPVQKLRKIGGED